MIDRVPLFMTAMSGRSVRVEVTGDDGERVGKTWILRGKRHPGTSEEVQCLHHPGAGDVPCGDQIDAPVRVDRSGGDRARSARASE